MEPLHPIEVRVLGALLEKDITTPEYYPLTLRALVQACNQKHSREPVVNYDDQTVLQALTLLRNKGLATKLTGAGHRVEKYGHQIGDRLNLGRRELALLSVLMLRGEQPVGLLRDRCERGYGFADQEEMEHVLETLANRSPDPLVVQTRRNRWTHLLCGAPVLNEDPPPESSGNIHASAGQDALGARLEALERELAALREEFTEFRRKFE